MADVGAASNVESVENVEKVVDIGVEGGVATEIKVVGVDAACADEVVENYGVPVSEVREDSLPG